MTSSISIASYNCRRLPKSNEELHLRPDILSLFESYDLVCFQETWLAKQNLDLCNSLHRDYLAVSVAAFDYLDRLLVGRPHGVVSIFYR